MRFTNRGLKELLPLELAYGRTLAESNAFIVLPGGTRGYKKEMFVDVLLLEDNEGSGWSWSNIIPSYKVRDFNGASTI